MSSTDVSNHHPADGVPAYLEDDRPAITGYYPLWVDKLADDATVEGSLLNGAAQGADAVRTIVLAIRDLYERQDHHYAGPCGDAGFLEDYTAVVRGGEPIGCVVLITSDADGKTQRVVAGYRPLNAAMFLSRLLAERFAGTPYAKYFLAEP
jgi:hypothetical protein